MKYLLLSLLFVSVLFSSGFVYSGDTGYSHTAHSAFTVVPFNYAGTQGTATFLGPLGNAQRTYQLLIRDSLLTGIVGQRITGFTYRLLASAVSNWPASDVTFTNYDIYLSGSVAPENRSLTFSQNIVGVQKRVRFGSLTITAGSFPAGGNPTTFGSEITFDSGYVYNGGHLLIEIRHTGFTGTSTSVDAIGTSTSGYGTLFSACWTGNYAGTSGTQGNFAVIRLTTGIVTAIENESESVRSFTLNQNYPNPFNPVTNISFELQRSAAVSLKVYDVSGAEVETLINNETIRGGINSILFNAEKLSSGIYFYSLFVDGTKVDTRKMILVK